MYLFRNLRTLIPRELSFFRKPTELHALKYLPSVHQEAPGFWLIEGDVFFIAPTACVTDATSLSIISATFRAISSCSYETDKTIKNYEMHVLFFLLLKILFTLTISQNMTFIVTL